MIRAVAIAASTGGPTALQKIVPRLPAGFPAAVFVVQHMPPGFTHGLAVRLGELGELPVREAVDGEPVLPGQVLVAPAGRQTWVVRSEGDVKVRVGEAGPVPGAFRPSADVLFYSLAEAYGQEVLAVVLTGMGKDGLKGLARVKEKGGLILAQDEASSVVFGMPRVAIEAGLADLVMGLEEMAAAIVSLVLKKT
ncbi:MAG: CheB methylesterase domain-containing protein [Clostridia bacterium]|jgi:two-component system chemotaxis response regulator CheB|nr:CheB methylesterase domain-containing protein [Clostridia bacterium]MDH7572607.1 CheB methylesterase domain-containing protein [Clostridia bacterium]